MGYSQQAAGMRPTGMHSCFSRFWSLKIWPKINLHISVHTKQTSIFGVMKLHISGNLYEKPSWLDRGFHNEVISHNSTWTCFSVTLYILDIYLNVNVFAVWVIGWQITLDLSWPPVLGNNEIFDVSCLLAERRAEYIKSWQESPSHPQVELLWDHMELLRCYRVTDIRQFSWLVKMKCKMMSDNLVKATKMLFSFGEYRSSWSAWNDGFWSWEMSRN